MKNPVSHFIRLVALVILAAPLHGASAEDDIECLKSADFLAPVDALPDHLYPPDREVKISHLTLDLTPDFKERTFEGTETFQFKPNGKPVQELRLDAVDLAILSVTATEKIQDWQSTTDKLVITFASPISIDQEATVTIGYHAEPTSGIYFRTPEMGYKEGDTHLFSQGEPVEARHWYPCFDSPNAKFTSEVTCRVPKGMTAVSNGRLVSSETDPATGLVVFHWSQEKPHANYLIAIAAGYFKEFDEKHDDIPLVYLTPPSDFNEAPAFFRDTKDIMGFFEEEIGVKFPWAKYAQVCVNDFVAGGMENTSATFLTDDSMFTPAMENIMDSDGLISHEMAHQWFGDLVTCEDWSDIWLNEGYATYYALLYDGHKNGRDAMLYGLYRDARRLTAMPDDTTAIVKRTYGEPDDVFRRYNYLSYPKGAWVLHMLRSELGADLYRRCIKTYLERHQYGNVATEDLRQVMAELSGRSYDQFFDQWLYHAHCPELEASYNWDEESGLAKVSIRQVQKIDQNVLLFNFPLTIRFKGKFGTVDRPVVIKDKDSEFYFPLASAPRIVRLDPELTILAKTTLTVPNEMLYAQLADKEDVIGRLLAVEKLSDKKDKATVKKLKDTLNKDPFYGVRNEAAQALRTIHSDEALEALLASTDQSDARVRLQVTRAIDGFYRDTASAFARKAVETEKNPVILAVDITALGKYGQPKVRDTLIKFLGSESYHNQLAGAAISAIRAQDDPAYIAPLMDTLGKHEPDFRTRSFATGLQTLAELAKNEEKKDAVREFLRGYLNHKKERIQVAAIEALGTLGDPASIAALQTLTEASKSSPQQNAAVKAVADLRAGRKPVDDFKNLRQELLDLQKASREQKKELDDLKKQIDAKAGVTSKSKSKNKPERKMGTLP